MFRFDPNKVTNEELGRGRFGTVYAYGDKNDSKSKKWAVKRIVNPQIEAVLKIIQEIVLGFSFDHPNILGIAGYHIAFDTEQEKWNINIKMSRKKETLGSVLDRHKRKRTNFSQTEIIKLFHGLLSGLEYLHDKRRIAHRDIKPGNILLDEQGRPLLADIGIGVYIGDEQSELVDGSVGTFGFMAPEVSSGAQLKSKELYKADMWSLGVVMVKLCLGCEHVLLDMTLRNQEVTGQEKEMLMHEKLSGLVPKYDEKLLKIIKDLVLCKPDRRKSAKEAILALEEAYPNILNVQEKSQIQSIKSGKGISEEHKSSINSDYSSIYKRRGPESPQETPMHKEKSQEQSSVSLFEEELKALSTTTSLDYRRVQELTHEKEKEKKKTTDEYIKMKHNLDAMAKRLSNLWKDTFKLTVSDKPLRLNIEPEDPEGIIDDNLTDLVNDMQADRDGETLRELEGVSLSLRSCNEVTERGATQTLRILSTRSERLSFLELDLWGWNRVEARLVKDIAAIISNIGTKMPDFTHLALLFPECQRLNGDAVKQITKIIIPDVPNLKQLKLNFNECGRISENAVKDLIVQIGENLGSLNSLELHFAECNGLTDDNVRELANQISSNLKKLTSLTLVLSDCKGITGNSIMLLGERIQASCSDLRRLKLGLFRTNVSNELVSSLKTILKSIKYVEIDC